MKKKKLKKLLKEEKQKVRFLSNKVDQLTKDINYQNNENVIYFDFMRLVISIMKKFIKIN